MSTDTQDSAPVGVKPVAVPDAILLMARRIAADNFEHCTSDPIFTVEKRNLIAGLDLDYTDNIGWFCEGEQVDDEDAAALEAAYQESGNVPDNYTRTGIEETWEHFATYVTLEAAREFVNKKGDRYRVYVDSGCRNHEWKALRAFLLQIAANPILAAPVAAQSDVTQQTLDDVMAGIPARDAEIAALRKEIETLQAAQAQQYVSGGNLADRLDVLADTASPGSQMQSDLYAAATIWRKHLKGPAAQQPVSGADDIEFLVRVLEQVSAWLPEDWSEFLERNPAVVDMLRPMVNHQTQQDADKVDAALAEMVHAMFRSGNSVPVTRITIDRKQYDAAIDAARKEQA